MARAYHGSLAAGGIPRYVCHYQNPDGVTEPDLERIRYGIGRVPRAILLAAGCFRRQMLSYLLIDLNPIGITR